MERKIGEIFEYNGEWYQCVKGHTCGECSFNKSSWNCLFDGTPYCSDRSDEIEVIFKKLEKVGEPYASVCPSRRVIYFQRYVTYIKPIISNEIVSYTTGGLNFIDIEIQTKEDMEEKNKAKHSNTEKIRKNLREFDLEAAKSGKPVCTKDGRKARIICFDRDWDMHIVALVADPLGESVHYYLSNGKVDFDKQNDEDLMMLPEKKEGWVNLYRDEESKRVYSGEFIFSEREKAEKYYECNDTKVATVHVNWEE